jgi:glutamate-ammonia-ligase adenylyltransferase
VAEIMGTSPAMAEFLGSHPQALEGVVSKDFFGRLPALDELKTELARQLDDAQDYQDALDIARRFAREKRFHAGIHILKNISPDEACGQYLADIAEAALRGLIPHVEQDFARQHGAFKTGEFVILAMGSFAARRMFTDSDLDIVALYKTPKEEQSKGPKPLPPNVYYIRLMQRVISALSAPTAEGVLYEADARLRPSGESGPLAASLEGFFEYQRKDAWIWEHMSLIRSRAVYASPATEKRLAAETLKVLSKKRDAAELRREMREMRAKVEKEFGSKDPWKLKYARGGIMDVMFTAQCLALLHGHAYKDVFQPNLHACLARLRTHGLLSEKDFKALSRALGLAQEVMSFLYLCAELPFNPKAAPEGLKEALLRRCAPGRKITFRAFEAELAKTLEESFRVYKSVLEK